MNKENRHIQTRHLAGDGQMPHWIIARVLHERFADKDHPVLVAVGGPGGIGKTTLAHKIAEELGKAVVLSLDDYKTTRRERAARNVFGPHPEANEMALIFNHLTLLRSNRAVDKPCYCHKQGQINRYVRFEPAPFIVVEGEVSTFAEFRNLIDFAVFVDSHWKTQLQTRITRDIEEKGYSPEKAIRTFLHSNLIEFPQYGRESKPWTHLHVHCDQAYRLCIDAADFKHIASVRKWIERDKKRVNA